MPRELRFLLSLLLVLQLGTHASAADGDSFRVSGPVERQAEWTAPQVLKELAGSVRTVRYQLRGEEHSARCVPLRLLVKPAAAQFDNEVKNHDLGFAVFVRGRDSYTASFSYAELAVEAEQRAVWLALEVDGKPLEGKESPARLLVLGDARPARWIYGIKSIAVVDGRRIE